MKTIQEYKSELPIIDTQIETLKNQLNALNDKKRIYEVMVFKLENNINLNDTLEFKDGKEIKKGVVTEFKSNWRGVFPVITLYKKDGTLGTRTKEFWSSSDKFVKI